MAATPLTTEFVDRLRTSGILADGQIDRVLRHAPDGSADAIASELVRKGLLTEYQSKKILCGKADELLIAGKYRVLQLLGRGGMGSVYLCEHLRMRRLVAVKVMPRERDADHGMLARFEREAQAAAALDHPNIVRAFDIDQADGHHYLVMEFIDGVDLQTVVARHGPLELSRVAWCVVQAARGLQHAWQTGWTHRDIKPGNLLLDRGGCVRILDMGLARVFNTGGTGISSLYQENLILGTADYLSPEQAAGINETDIRADIYSLGATCYYLLSGRSPFEDGSVSQKLLWHRTLMPMPIQLRRPEVPDSMAAVLERMLAKDPSKRFATPSEVAEAWEPFCDPPPPPPADIVMPAWDPAVFERIGATVSEPATQRFEKVASRKAPETSLFPTPIARVLPPETRVLFLSKRISVPRWLAACTLLLLAACVGWIIYREANLPRKEAPEMSWPEASTAPTRPIGQ